MTKQSLNGLNRVGIAVVILAGLLSFQGCANVPITGRNRTVIINESVLASMSATEYKKMVSSAKRSTDNVEIARLNRVAERLVAATNALAKQYGFEKDVEGYQWEFVLIDDPKVINAFCMPGGKVAVYTGILPISQTDAGLAVILGHEIAHAIAKHGNERMSQSSLVNFGGSVLSKSLETSPGESQALFKGLYSVGTSLGVLLPYSRMHETEADRIGIMIMAKAGYDPQEAIQFWQRMASIKGGKSSPEFLSTHPSDQSRINDIEAVIRSL